MFLRHRDKQLIRKAFLSFTLVSALGLVAAGVAFSSRRHAEQVLGSADFVSPTITPTPSPQSDI